jgi:phytoene dehydrogenase-like protein
VSERNCHIGGCCSSAEATLPGFRHDLGSSVFPMGVASPFFQSLPIQIPWIEPPAPCAHPLDDGTAVLLEHSLEDTVANLDACDGRKYRSLLEPLVERFPELLGEILGPIPRIPQHPFLLARFGLSAVLPAASLARSRFEGVRARALLAGMAAHSVLSLEASPSSAVGLVLMAAGHASGWPIVQGGAQTLTDALAGYLELNGGRIEPSYEVTQLPVADVVLAGITPRQLIQIAGPALPPAYRRVLERFQYGAGVFKVDYALSSPIPWTAKDCARAATVHIGGTLEEIIASERHFQCETPYVLLAQPSLFDSARAPAGKHTAWAYCHVPNGSAVSRLEAIERQIERFAPGFRDCVLARFIWTPGALEPEPRWRRSLWRRDELPPAFVPPGFFALQLACAGAFSLWGIDPPGGRRARNGRVSCRSSRIAVSLRPALESISLEHQNVHRVRHRGCFRSLKGFSQLLKSLTPPMLLHRSFDMHAERPTYLQEN